MWEKGLIVWCNIENKFCVIVLVFVSQLPYSDTQSYIWDVKTETVLSVCKILSFDMKIRDFVWNFKWTFEIPQIVLPRHWKICIWHRDEFLWARISNSLWAFLKRFLDWHHSSNSYCNSGKEMYFYSFNSYISLSKAQKKKIFTDYWFCSFILIYEKYLMHITYFGFFNIHHNVAIFSNFTSYLILYSLFCQLIKFMNQNIINRFIYYIVQFVLVFIKVAIC